MAPEKTVEELASLAGGRVVGDGSVVIKDVASIEEAGPGDITLMASPRYAGYIESTRASAILVGDEKYVVEGKNFIVVDNPYLAFARILECLRPGLRPQPGVHPKAEIHKEAHVGKDVTVCAFVTIEEGARIGDRVVIYPGVYIGRDVEIGDDTIIYSNVSIREGTKIGNRVIIHCNSVIGSDGFGYAKEGSHHYKIPQTGIVRIEDDVEIGACVTIDRATLGETVIGRGTKIDNLVQIAHNVRIGEDSIIVAQVGVSGSTRIGSRVTLAGQVGVVGHIEIGDDVTIGAQSGVAHSLPSRGVFSGSPAMPHPEWLRAQSIFARLPEMRRRLNELERRLRELEEKD